MTFILNKLFCNQTMHNAAGFGKHYSSSFSKSNYLGKKLLVITGGTAHLAQEIRAIADERGYEVISCTRRPVHAKQRGNWERIDETQLCRTDYWKNLLQRISKGVSKVVLINTIGTAIPPRGERLEDINERPILAAIEALKTLNMPTTIGQISSIAGTYFPDDDESRSRFDQQATEYCLGRKRIDLVLESCGIPATILRPGFVFSKLHQGEINSGHDYSPEQFTSLLLHPIIGSGQQLHQPVFSIDLVTALFNGVETEETHMLNAVGPIPMTQEEMIKFYIELAGNTFRPVKVPNEVAKVMARHFPKGRFAPYAVSLLDHLEENFKDPLPHEPFEVLVGRPLSTIDLVYNNTRGKPLIFPRSPICEHIKEIFMEIAKNPEARVDFIRVVRKYGPPVVLQCLKQLFRPDGRTDRR